MKRGSSLFVLVLATIVCVSHALFEENAGKTDWENSHVGQVHLATFHPSQQLKRLFIGTRSNVLAALNVRTSHIVWRQVLPDGEELNKLILHDSNRKIVTLSGNGAMLRLWNANNGNLVWDVLLSKSATTAQVFSVVSLDVDLDDDGHPDVAVLHSNVISIRSAATGEEISVSTDIPESQVYSDIYATKASGTVHAVGVENGSACFVSVNGRSGKVTAQECLSSMPARVAEGSSSVVLTGSSVLVTVSDSGVVRAVGLRKDSVAASVNMADFLPASTGSNGGYALEVPGHHGSAVVVNLPGDRASVLLRAAEKGGTVSLEVVHTWDRDSHVVAFGTDQRSALHVSSATVSSSQLDVSVVNFDSKTVEALSSSEINTQENGSLVQAFLNVFVNPEGTPGYRALVVTEDAALALVQNGKFIWRREEALAEVTQVEFWDLPHVKHIPDTLDGEAQSETMMASIQNSLWHSFYRPVLSSITNVGVLNEFMNMNFGSVMEHLQHDLDVDAISRDQFGFKKLIVAMTKSGMLYALRTDTGKILWRRYVSPKSGGAVQSDDRIFVSLTGAHFPSECVVVGSESRTSSFISWIDPIFGKESRRESLPYAILQTVWLPLVDSKHAHLILVVGTDLKAHLFPDTPDAQAVLVDHASQIFFYITNTETGDVNGYGVSVDADGSVIAHPTWAVSTGSPIIASAARNKAEVVDSSVKVMSDRSVLHKYLNPNLLVVASAVPGSTQGSSYADGTVHVFIIDTVTGAVYDHMVYRNAQGPVHLLHSENWVVISYWSNRAHRTEISVTEMIEPRDGDEWSFAESKDKKKFSSFQDHHPDFLRQSYTLPATVKTLGVTLTRHGLAWKQILVGLSSDKVLALEKAFIDPRRPRTKVKGEDGDENLPAYSPVLPLKTQSIVSHNNTVTSLRMIASTATFLESASIVVGVGLDMFLCRVFPSKDFDHLADDFNYFFLVVTFSLLILATFVAKFLARKAHVNSNWQ